MESISQINFLGRKATSEDIFNNFNDYLICKVKFSAFNDYESICFLPTHFSDLVKIFSEAFYPNDFGVIYLDNMYGQHSIHSDETYDQMLEDIYKSEVKEINCVKFHIILHNVKIEENHKEKVKKINQNIRCIFEREKKSFIDRSNSFTQLNDNSSKSMNIDDNINLKKNESCCSIISLANSCECFYNRKIDSFKIMKKDFSFIDKISSESLSDCGKITQNKMKKINKENKGVRKNNSEPKVDIKKNYKKNEVSCY